MSDLEPTIKVLFAASSACIIYVGRRSFTGVRIGLLCLVCALLMIRAGMEKTPEQFDPHHFTGSQQVTVLIDSSPRETRNATQFISHQVDLISDAGEVWVGGLQVTLPRYTVVEYGDVVSLTGKLVASQEVEDPGYRQYLLNHQVYGTMLWPEVEILARGKGNPAIAAGKNVQEHANNNLQKLLPRDAAAFVAGVALGSRQELSEKFDDALKLTGTTHLIVASGYNVSVLIGMVLIIAKHHRAVVRTILALTIIVCYLFISGLDPSIIRASIMAALLLLSSLLGRQRESLYLLLATAVLMLFAQPFWLLDTGFQLSFLATMGIILLQPVIANYLKALPLWLSESLSTTISAQVLVLPVIATTFGAISLISILTNTLVGWVIPIVMILGGLLLISSTIFDFAGSIIVMVLYPVFYYIKQVILTTSKLPFASLPVSIGWVGVVFYYSAIGLLYFRRSVVNDLAK